MLPEVQDLIDKAKAEGFSVYAPKNISSYFYVTKDNKVGYCQHSPMTGASFATVHKANTTTGTGFKVDSFEQSLSFAPAWASSLGTVVKFASFEAFRRQHWQELIQY